MLYNHQNSQCRSGKKAGFFGSFSTLSGKNNSFFAMPITRMVSKELIIRAIDYANHELLAAEGKILAEKARSNSHCASLSAKQFTPPERRVREVGRDPNNPSHFCL